MLSPDDLSKAVDRYWESLPPTWHRTRSVIRGIAAEKFNLTVEQFQVLRRIRRGFASVSSIAQDSRTSRSAVSKAVDVLVHRALVSRQQDPRDRRNIPLSLTPEGEHALSTIFNEAEDWLSARFSQLSSDEINLAIRGMEILQKAFLSQ